MSAKAERNLEQLRCGGMSDFFESENRGIGASRIFSSTLRFLDSPILCTELHSKTL